MRLDDIFFMNFIGKISDGLHIRLE